MNARLLLGSVMLLLSACSANTPAAVVPDSLPGWRLVWSDEFDYTGLPDSARWTYEEGMIRNRELQYYTRGRPENARVEDGTLIIEARRERWDTAQYTSASLNTLAAGNGLAAGGGETGGHSGAGSMRGTSNWMTVKAIR